MQIKLLKAYSAGNRKKETKNNLMIQKQEKGKKEGTKGALKGMKKKN